MMLSSFWHRRHFSLWWQIEMIERRERERRERRKKESSSLTCLLNWGSASDPILYRASCREMTPSSLRGDRRYYLSLKATTKRIKINLFRENQFKFKKRTIYNWFVQYDEWNFQFERKKGQGQGQGQGRKLAPDNQEKVKKVVKEIRASR